MNSALLAFCVLLDLVTPGYSVTCIECYNKTAPYCTGPAKYCGTGICMSGLISLDEYTLFGRACAPNETPCGVSGSSTSTGRTLLSTSCCKSSNCTPAELNLPSTNTIKNGLICQTCTPSTGKICNLECMGDEKHCAYIEFTTMGPSDVKRLSGCATDSLCNFGNQTFDIEGAVFHLGIVCNSAPTVDLQHCFRFVTIALFTSLIKK